MNDKIEYSNGTSYGNAPANSSGGSMGELQPYSSSPTRIKEAYTKALESGLVLTEQTAFTLGHLAAQKEAAEQKPVSPDWYMNPQSEQWFECPDDAQIIEDIGPLAVGQELEFDVCWSGTAKFIVSKIPDNESDDYEFTKVSGTKLYAAPVDQSARIAELEAKVERWKSHGIGLQAINIMNNEAANKELAAAQAENAKLRKAISLYLAANDPTEFGCACDLSVGYLCGPCRVAKRQEPLVEVLATPSDNTALEALLEAERQKVAEACAVMCDKHPEIVTCLEASNAIRLGY